MSDRLYVEDNEFYAAIRGYDLKGLPDIPIVCKPLLNTSTHVLALETSPRWCLRIRHKGSWGIKTRPKVRLYPESQPFHGAPSVSFALPACERFSTLDDAIRALRAAEFTLSPNDIRITAVQRRDVTREAIRHEERTKLWDSLDEFEVLQRFNDIRCEELRRRPKPQQSDTVRMTA